MRAKGDNFLYLTFNIYRAFINDGCIDLFALLCGEVHGFKFIQISAAAHAAEVAGIRQPFCNQIDDKFACFLDDIVGMAARTDGNVGHGRVAVDSACPCYGDDIFLLHCAAGDHNGRDGINDSPRFPDIFSHSAVLLSWVSYCLS